MWDRGGKMSEGLTTENTAPERLRVDSDGSGLIWFAVALFILVNIAVLVAGGFGPATAENGTAASTKSGVPIASDVRP